MNGPMRRQTGAASLGSKLHFLGAVAALSLAFCHSPTEVDGGPQYVILSPPDGGTTGHHDAGVDAGDASITQNIPDASLQLISLSQQSGSSQRAAGQ